MGAGEAMAFTFYLFLCIHYTLFWLKQETSHEHPSTETSILSTSNSSRTLNWTIHSASGTNRSVLGILLGGLTWLSICKVFILCGAVQLIHSNTTSPLIKVKINFIKLWSGSPFIKHWMKKCHNLTKSKMHQAFNQDNSTTSFWLKGMA